jgi:ribosomal protein S18 acetylase RimI-like enzyme
MDNAVSIQRGQSSEVPKIEGRATLDKIKPIRTANKDDLKQLSELFNSYRCFYGRESDLTLATDFLAERLEKNESIIFVAETENGHLAGFVQLYPTFSSVSAKRAWILNDLYVKEDYRKCGIANQLVSQVLEFGRETRAAWVSLQTAVDNAPAQALYEKMGFTRETYFCEFSYTL